MHDLPVSNLMRLLPSWLSGIGVVLIAAAVLANEGGAWNLLLLDMDRTQWCIVLGVVGSGFIGCAALVVAARADSVGGGILLRVIALLGLAITACGGLWYFAWADATYTRIDLAGDTDLVVREHAFLDTHLSFLRTDGLLLFGIGSGSVIGPSHYFRDGHFEVEQHGDTVVLNFADQETLLDLKG